jgi:hypothetical protein
MWLNLKDARQLKLGTSNGHGLVRTLIWMSEGSSDRRRRVGYAPNSGHVAAARQVKSWAVYGRRPRCKRNLTISEAFGCGHVFGL